MLKTLIKTRDNKLRGVTLIEALLFLGIGAVVLIGAFSIFNNASNSAKMNEAQTQIQAYISGVKSLYGSRDTYASVNNQVMIAAGKVPENAVRGTGGLQNPWSGTTTITGAANWFEIELAALPDEACIALLSANMLDTGSIFRIEANGSQPAGGANPTPAQAMSACDRGASNSVTFRVR